jgi:uncharacterized protein (DUF58 family)
MAIRALFLTDRFFLALGSLIGFFALSFAFPVLYLAALLLFMLMVVVIIVEGLLLFQKNVAVSCERKLPKALGLGDDNTIRLHLHNHSPFTLSLTVADETPEQFQIRDFSKKTTLTPNQVNELQYTLHPVERGVYIFGCTNIYVSGRFGLLERRIQTNVAPQEVAVYPSVLQMKQLELLAFEKISTPNGLKRIRKIGHSYEFEQIKNYVPGDDYRSINWKASGRRGDLMVNQYEDERSQQVYCLIDKSRVMRMPFEGLSLMDYAINAALAISNVILHKYDKAGLITFADKIGASIKADSRPTQLNLLLNALYKERERPMEANYELLYHIGRKLIAGRSLLLLFTNFESLFALERVLPILRRINKQHLLVVIFFENSEIRAFADRNPNDLEGIYFQTIARNFLAEKNQMVQKLRQFGIQSVLTRPEDLSLNTINKYLELKARGLI